MLRKKKKNKTKCNWNFYDQNGAEKPMLCRQWGEKSQILCIFSYSCTELFKY